MRILIVNMYYYPNMIGGAEHSVKILAETLHKKGNEVYIYSLDGANPLDVLSPEIINGVKVFRGFSKSIYERRIKGNKHAIDKLINGIHSIRNPNAIKDIEHIIASVKPNILHTNNLVSISYECWEIVKKYDIGLVHTLRDYWLLDPTTVIGKSNRIVVYLFRKHTKKLTRNFCGCITAPSQKVIDIFLKNKYFTAVPNYVVENCIEFDEDNTRSIIQYKLLRKDNKVKFIYAGYLSHNKGILKLLEEFSVAKSKNIELIICGNGPLEKEVINATDKDDRIKYLGKIDKDELEKVYNDGDVLIVPSLWDEPFGRIIIEGAALGLPVIGSNKGGIPEIITKLGNGEIIDLSLDGNLSNAIERFSDRQYIKKYITQITRNISMYSTDYQTMRFISIYKTMIGNCGQTT